MVSVNDIFIILTEVSIFIIITILTGLLAYNHLGIKPFQRGFYCDDQSISYPYHDDTVSDTVVILTFVLVPAIIIVFIESIHILVTRRKKHLDLQDTFAMLGTAIYRSMGAFVFGAILTLFITEVLKVSAGRLRPHFLSVCNLNYTKVDCASGFIEITNEDCINTDEKKLLDARKSFPSGHSSGSAFGAVYLIIYLYYRFTWPRPVRVVVPTIQTLIFCAAAYVGISRVSDNKHHFSDVISGSLLGTVMAVLVVYFMSCVTGRRRVIDQSSKVDVIDDNKSNTNGAEKANMVEIKTVP